ncbi:MAG: DUF3788 domain-containing protein [Micrococcales bacterium]|nr:DUF3788 domain-containing protein [Micrococcales bacterium]
MDALQLLRDSAVEPTSDVIAASLGAANDAFVRFVGGLESHNVEVTWRYYNDGKSWLGKALHKWTTSRGTPKEVTTFWLSIWDGFFRLSFYIPEKARLALEDLQLSDEVMDMVKTAKQMGKLEFFPLVFDVRSDEQFDDLYALVDFRASVK